MIWRLGLRESVAGRRFRAPARFTDFQARRANIRFRPEPGAKPEFVHTLNASGVAFPRTMHRPAGEQPASRWIGAHPQALVPYLGTDRLTAAWLAPGSASWRPRWWFCWWRCSPA